MNQISKTNLRILGIILSIKEGELENLIPLKIIISYLSENLMFNFKGQFVSNEYTRINQNIKDFMTTTFVVNNTTLMNRKSYSRFARLKEGGYNTFSICWFNKYYFIIMNFNFLYRPIESYDAGVNEGLINRCTILL